MKIRMILKVYSSRFGFYLRAGQVALTCVLQAALTKQMQFPRVPRPLPLPPSRPRSAVSTQPTGAWRPASCSPPLCLWAGPRSPKPRRRLWDWASTAESSTPHCHTACRSVMQHSKPILKPLPKTCVFIYCPVFLSRILSLAQSCAVPFSRVWFTGSIRLCPGFHSSQGSTLRGTSLGRAPHGPMTPHYSRVSWANGERIWLRLIYNLYTCFFSLHTASLA